MFEVRVSFDFDDDFVLNDDRLHAVAGASSHSGAGMGRRDHGFERSKFQDAFELKEQIKREFPSWNVTMREK